MSKSIKNLAKMAAIAVVAAALAESFGVMDKVRQVTSKLRSTVGIGL